MKIFHIISIQNMKYSQLKQPAVLYTQTKRGNAVIEMRVAYSRETAG